MSSSNDLDLHRAEANAHRSVSKLRGSLNELANKIEKPSRRVRNVRRGIDRTKTLPWREIALGLGALLVVSKLRKLIFR